MTRSALLIAMWLIATAPASAEIFKCAGKDGMDRYQNFPCSMDSIGSAATAAPPANTDWPHRSSSQAASVATSVVVTTASRSVKATEPRIGMTEGEVRAIWGEPSEIEQDEPRDGRIEIWHYGDGRFVQFSNKHRVLVVQR